MTVQGPSTRRPRVHPAPRATQSQLWHIESRWDYWELTPDEPVILEELAAYRAAGGGTLVDLTVPVSDETRPGSPAGGAERPPRRDRRGWYRTPTTRPSAGRSPVGRFAGRGARRRGTVGVGDTGSGPGSWARSGRTSRGSRRPRSGSTAPWPGRAPPDRPGDHDPRRPVRRGGRPADDLRGGRGGSRARGHRPRGQLPAPRPLPVADHRAAPRSSSTSWACFTPTERHGEGRIIDLLLELLLAATPTASCSARTCATTPTEALRGQRLHVPPRHVPAAAPGARRVPGGDRPDDDREPAADPDDPLGFARGRRPRALPGELSRRPAALRWPAATNVPLRDSRVAPAAGSAPDRTIRSARNVARRHRRTAALNVRAPSADHGGRRSRGSHRRAGAPGDARTVRPAGGAFMVSNVRRRTNRPRGDAACPASARKAR